MKSESRTENISVDSLYRVLIIGVAFVVFFSVLLLVVNKYYDLNNCKIQPEALTNVTATFMAIAAAIMLASQIYFSFNKTKAEQDLKDEIDSLKKDLEKEKEYVTKMFLSYEQSFNEITEIKYTIYDAIAAIHKREGRILEGMIDVLKKINLILEFTIVIKKYNGRIMEILGHAVYCIAHNLKHLKEDRSITNNNIRDFEIAYNDWHNNYKVFMTTILSKEDLTWLTEDISRIDVIITKIKNQIKKNSPNCFFEFDKDDFLYLDDKSHD